MKNTNINIQKKETRADQDAKPCEESERQGSGFVEKKKCKLEERKLLQNHLKRNFKNKAEEAGK